MTLKTINVDKKEKNEKESEQTVSAVVDFAAQRLKVALLSSCM